MVDKDNLIERKDITLSEESNYWAYGNMTTTEWRASAFGTLGSGEWVDMSRTGDTATEAYDRLKEALAEQGWGIG